MTAVDIAVLEEAPSPAPVRSWWEQFIEDASDDEVNDLAEVGALPVSDTPDLSSLDLMASDVLRRLASVTRTLDQMNKVQAAEREMLEARQLRASSPLRERARRLHEQATVIAQMAESAGAFRGKAQSRKTGYGSYGRKRTGERFAVTDRAAAVQWARANMPEAVEVDLTLTVNRYMALFSALTPEQAPLLPELSDPGTVAVKALEAHFRATGEEIPGTEMKPEKVEYYGKPVQDDEQ